MNSPYALRATSDERSFLDILYGDAPDTRPRFRWPVTDDPFTMKPLAWFDSYGAAVDAVSANPRLYICEPVRQK